MKITKTKYGKIKYQVFKGDEQISGYVELLSIFVNEEYRHQGYGTELIGLLMLEAKKLGIKEIITRANTDGESDIFGKFLTENGFEKTFYTIFSKTL